MNNIDYKYNDFDKYKAKYLDEIKHIFINDKYAKRLYDFIAEELYEVFEYAQEEHDKFFWGLNHPIKDYDHYTEQAKAWSIPVYDFEINENDDEEIKIKKKEIIFKRMMQGLNFVRLKGTEKQVSDMLDIILGKEGWFYAKEHKLNVFSINIKNYTDEKRDNVMKYLEEAIPPYIKIETNPFVFSENYKTDTYDGYIKKGGSNYIKKEFKKHIVDCLMLPDDAFRINKSKLNEDVVKVINDKGQDRKVIIVFLKNEPGTIAVKKDIKVNLFDRAEHDNIFFFTSNKSDFGN